MKKNFLIGDTHFGHHGVTQFLKSDGTKLRPWNNVNEMDEALVDNWNSVVNKNDTVRILGDVVINRRALPTIARLNGRKLLYFGNHDIFRNSEYLKYFEEVRGYYVTKHFIGSHIPIHPDSLGRYKFNVHGHLHSDNIDDKRYICVSAEQVNYTPISYEDVLNIIEERNEI